MTTYAQTTYAQMNSFQQWATTYAQAYGFTVEVVGNWVALLRGSERIVCMARDGVQRACDATMDGTDQNGVAFAYSALWAYGLNENLTDGTQCNTARALQIAMDVMQARGDWSEHDRRVALSVLAGVRAQRGVFGPDADALDEPDGIEATRQIDIWVFG